MGAVRSTDRSPVPPPRPRAVPVWPVITSGFGLNELGHVVGSYKCPGWEHEEAFLWTPEDGFTTLVRPEGVSSARANDISETGVIVGTHVVDGVGFRAFVLEDGQVKELSPEVGFYAWGYALNADAIVVGVRTIEQGTAPVNAFTWSVADGFVDLGIMSGPSSFGTDISNHGEVVGWTGNQTGSIAEAFLWSGGAFSLLGSIPGGFTSQARAVSNNGVITGDGRIPLQGAPTGAPVAFRWKNGQYKVLNSLPDHTFSSASDISPDGRQCSW